jgi:hypothetical protein
MFNSGQGAHLRLFFILFVFLNGCAWHPRTEHYRASYAHLKNAPSGSMIPADRQLVVLVCARHLDYQNTQRLLKTVAKHPDGGMRGDVGHAWILLQGGDEVIEGGPSGELGVDEPKYFDGMMDLVEEGDPNPIRYLHRTLNDGFFEEGSGDFSPTYAIKVSLSPEQYQVIRHYVLTYDYAPYSLTKRQCIAFVTDVAAMAGLALESEVHVPTPPTIRVGKDHIRVWSDPAFSTLTFMSPDVLEKSMMEAVYRGDAEYALGWYRQTHETSTWAFEWEHLFERLVKIYLL